MMPVPPSFERYIEELSRSELVTSNGKAVPISDSFLRFGQPIVESHFTMKNRQHKYKGQA